MALDHQLFFLQALELSSKVGVRLETPVVSANLASKGGFAVHLANRECDYQTQDEEIRVFSLGLSGFILDETQKLEDRTILWFIKNDQE